MKTEQDSHDLAIGKGCLAVTTAFTVGTWKRIFLYLEIKILAKFI
jgi:hypothetical protein